MSKYNWMKPGDRQIGDIKVSRTRLTFSAEMLEKTAGYGYVTFDTNGTLIGFMAERRSDVLPFKISLSHRSCNLNLKVGSRLPKGNYKATFIEEDEGLLVYSLVLIK